MSGFEKTFKLLSQTKNDAAVAVLIPCLDSNSRRVRDEALAAILARRNPSGLKEILRRLATMRDEWRDPINERPGRMTQTLRDALLGHDGLCETATQAIVWFREYDLVPALINALEDQANPNCDLAAKTLVELVTELYQELAGPRDYRNRRDPQLVRKHVTTSLEKSVAKFSKHRRIEVVQALLMIASRDNAFLRTVLADPHHAAHLASLEQLARSDRPSIMRLLLSFLDDNHPPLPVLQVLARRADPPFLGNLLQRVGFEPSAAACQNLKRVDSIPWLEHVEVFDALDDNQQHAAVQMMIHSGMRRAEVYEILEGLLHRGKAGARRAAVTALAEFKGADANALVLRALDDADPQVQARAITQLRQRSIPGALTRLLEMIDSPHDTVRSALRDSLTEFTFERFMTAYESLTDEVRRSTGGLVKKLDPHWKMQLLEEFKAPSRSRRLRGISVALSIGAVPELEGAIVPLLRDEDHLVRLEAAKALRWTPTDMTLTALRETLLDSSPAVQEAAAESLRQLSMSLPPPRPPQINFPSIPTDGTGAVL